MIRRVRLLRCGNVQGRRSKVTRQGHNPDILRAETTGRHGGAQWISWPALDENPESQISHGASSLGGGFCCCYCCCFPALSPSAGDDGPLLYRDPVRR